jgi:hypothetical protein
VHLPVGHPRLGRLLGGGALLLLDGLLRHRLLGLGNLRLGCGRGLSGLGFGGLTC